MAFMALVIFTILYTAYLESPVICRRYLAFKIGSLTWILRLSKTFPSVSDDCFFANYELGQMLADDKGSEAREFRDNSRLFLHSLVAQLLSLVYATSSVSQRLYCFCPELKSEGVDSTVLDLFSKLLRVFREGGYITPIELVDTREEFCTFVVDIR